MIRGQRRSHLCSSQWGHTLVNPRGLPAIRTGNKVWRSLQPYEHPRDKGKHCCDDKVSLNAIQSYISSSRLSVQFLQFRLQPANHRPLHKLMADPPSSEDGGDQDELKQYSFPTDVHPPYSTRSLLVNSISRAEARYAE